MGELNGTLANIIFVFIFIFAEAALDRPKFKRTRFAHQHTFNWRGSYFCL